MSDEIKRTYTIPLRRGFANTPRYKRTNKAIRVLKEFLVKHMKSDDVKIGPKLNELVWENGIKNPIGKVKVTATKDKNGVVRAELEGVVYKDFKPQEKKEEPKSMKEKLQSKVKEATGKEEAKPVETPAIDKIKEETTKPGAKKTETEEKPKVAKTPAKTETQSNEVAGTPKQKVSSEEEVKAETEPAKEN